MVREVPLSTEPTTEPATAVDDPVTPLGSLRDLERAIAECDSCGLQHERTSPVVGAGPDDARLMIVGSVPRRHEDLRGDPFAGATGNVLLEALGRAGMTKGEVRMTMVVRCRAEDDRNPVADEVRACARLFFAEVELIRPEVLVTLGPFATSVVLGRPVPIDRVAGYRLDVLGGITLVPTYHPVDAVRGVPQASPSLRHDIAVAKAVLDGRLASGAEGLQLRAQRSDAPGSRRNTPARVSHAGHRTRATGFGPGCLRTGNGMANQ